MSQAARAGGERPCCILIISYLFPPAGGIAVQRSLSLAKYLPAYGYEVHVLKAENAAAPVHDPGLLQHIPDGTRIYGAFTPELPFAFRQKLWRWLSGGRVHESSKTAGQNPRAPKTGFRSSVKSALIGMGKRLLSPEPEVLWVPFALRQARKIIRKHAIDAVLVTAPPFSAFLVGNTLKRDFPELKLISDFRDDWVRFYVAEFAYQKNDYTRRRAIEIERQTVELSDRVIVVTETTLDHMRARYPDQRPDKFVFIPNGYDPDAFRGFCRRKHEGDKVLISHLGTVYSAASPRYYLDAVDSLPDDIRASFETHFVGRITAEEKSFLEGRRSEIRTFGFMPQAEGLRHVESTDYLLLTMADGPSLPGKLFEYLAMGKPVLAISPLDGEVARILRRTGAGRCVAPTDMQGIRNLLLDVYHHKQQGSNGFRPDWNEIQRFERQRLAGEFGTLIRNIV
jgi:glycosyltransferase involved in cell wall biosynthesis